MPTLCRPLPHTIARPLAAENIGAKCAKSPLTVLPPVSKSRDIPAGWEYRYGATSRPGSASSAKGITSHHAADRQSALPLTSSPAASVAPTAASARPVDESSAASTDLRRAPESEPPVPEVVRTYEGFLSPLKNGFERYLQSLGISASIPSASGMSFRDSLLALQYSNPGAVTIPTTRE